MNKTLFLKTLFGYLFLTSSVFSFSQFTIYNTSNSNLPYNTVRCIDIDSNNHVWAGTDDGLAKFDGSNWTIYNTSNSGLTDNQIRSIEFDDNGTLWVGTLVEGLFSYDGSVWTNYNYNNSDLPDNQIKDIEFDQDGFMWVATTGGLAMYNGVSWTIWNVFNSSLPTNNISCIEIAQNNEKHIGAVNGGLQIISPDNLSIITYWSYNSSLIDNTILKVAFDSSNNLWMATPSGGLITHFTGDNWVFYNTLTSTIPSNSATYILIDNNLKYIPTIDFGLVIYNGISFQSYNMSNSNLPDDFLYCISKDASGNFWMGSYNGGLIKFNPATVGLDEHLNSSSFTLINASPNGNLINLHLSQKCIAECYDISGRLIFKTSDFFEIFSIDKPGQSGIYIFKFTNEKGESISSKLFVN